MIPAYILRKGAYWATVYYFYLLNSNLSLRILSLEQNPDLPYNKPYALRRSESWWFWLKLSVAHN